MCVCGYKDRTMYNDIEANENNHYSPPKKNPKHSNPLLLQIINKALMNSLKDNDLFLNTSMVN